MAKPKKKRCKNASQDDELARAIHILTLVSKHWYEIQAAHAIMGEHIKEIQEAING